MYERQTRRQREAIGDRVLRLDVNARVDALAIIEPGAIAEQMPGIANRLDAQTY